MKFTLPKIRFKERLAWLKQKSRWGKITLIIAAVAAFLGTYDTLRNKGGMFVCDTVALVGLNKLITSCDKPGPDKDKLALYEFLKAREATLSKAQKQQLAALEQYYIDQAFKVLAKDIKSAKTQAAEQAATALKQELETTLKQGEALERRAIALIGEGQTQQGLDLLTRDARDTSQHTVEKWRRIGRLAFGVDTQRAIQAYEAVMKLDQTNPWDAIYLGRLYVIAGDLGRARQVFETELKHLPQQAERDRSVLLDEIGAVQVTQGSLAAALQSCQAALAIRERLARADPGNSQWQRDLSVAHDRIGDVQRAQGSLAAALQSYQAALAIAERLARVDPGNSQWQRDLAVSLERLAGFPNSGVSWQVVVDQYNKLQAAGTLLPGDVEFAEQARRRAQGSPP